MVSFEALPELNRVRHGFSFYSGVKVLLYNLEEAAQYLGVSKRSLRGLCHRRAISFIRLNRYEWRFSETDLLAFLERRKVCAKTLRG
jgi:excisionase family DNA binding protein